MSAALQLRANEGFLAAIRTRLDQVEREAALLAGDTAVEILWRCARRTPVLLGRARGHWSLHLNSYDGVAFDDAVRDPRGEDTVARAREVAKGVKLGDQLWIVNPAPYIGRLNDGYSSKAPAGFIDQSAAEAPFIVQMLALGMRDRLHGRGMGVGPTLGTIPGGSAGGAGGGGGGRFRPRTR